MSNGAASANGIDGVKGVKGVDDVEGTPALSQSRGLRPWSITRRRFPSLKSICLSFQVCPMMGLIQSTISHHVHQSRQPTSPSRLLKAKHYIK